MGRWFNQFAHRASTFAGHYVAFLAALAIVVVWAVTGPFFGFSETWQLVINTGTTIVTFLMVFLIQRSQNKESMAVQLKLNELVAAVRGASNHLIDIENLNEDELQVLHRHYEKLAAMAKRDVSVSESHSVEEAKVRHTQKRRERKG